MAIPLRTTLFWRALRLVEGTPIATLPPERVRAASDRRRRLVTMPGAWLVVGRADPGARIEQLAATLPDGTVLPLRVYRPREEGAGRLPVVVNFHGGGFAAGDPRQSEWLCSSVAAQVGAVVVSVDYRLAPEHPFPVGSQDCYAATLWVAEHADELGIDPGRLAVMGDSAGGNLAAVVSVMARDANGGAPAGKGVAGAGVPAIAAQVLIYPCVEMVDTFPSEIENADAPVLTKADIDGFTALYLPDGGGADPLASPLRAKLDGLPPALIQTAEHDPLRDQGAAFAAALRSSGVAVRLTNYVDAVHGYLSIPGLMPSSRQALAEIVATLRETFAE